MILKIVRRDSNPVEYFDVDSIFKNFIGKVGSDEKEPSISVQGVRAGQVIYDTPLQKGDVAYVMEHGKTADCFEG